MQLNELTKIPERDQHPKLTKVLAQFNKLLAELRKKELPEKSVIAINREIDKINTVSGSEKKLKRQLSRTQSAILKEIEKEANLVTKNHYRNTWLAVGMAAFGIPLGVAFGLSLGNMAFLGIGLPIGLAVGLAIGTGMDKKAAEEGRQLDVEIAY
ncbi:hypothetical protein SAMN05192553_103394 [Cyclobacterium xiamenense]|uniref:Uncharacterized protein n=1 Tax=Cyclobacterium xiamenense TaxID=1297121 RepID=A0A1H6Y0Y4_9BACT|nr:hypothetical protein [Cyclobacterium xiamenense]SEJ34931.1 hypothetical protein SAMN05192553_103394 [Cyclobacterium xiamenense]